MIREHGKTENTKAAQHRVQPTAFGAGGRGPFPCKRRGLQRSHPLQPAAANANRWALSIVKIKEPQYFMKFPIRLSIFVFLATFLLSCNSVSPTESQVIPTLPLVTISTAVPESTPSSNVIPLEFDNQKILLEFLQNDASVPCSNNQNLCKISLKPEPFTLMVFGDKKVVSIMALKSVDMSLPLQNVSKPLVAPSGMGNMFWEHNLYLFDQPNDIEVYDLSSFFTQYFIKPDQATELSDYLKKKLDTEPTVFATGRTYLGIERGGEPNYSISKIGNKTIGNYIQSGNSMALVVFIEKDLGKDYFQLNWVIFILEFQ